MGKMNRSPVDTFVSGNWFLNKASFGGQIEFLVKEVCHDQEIRRRQLPVDVEENKSQNRQAKEPRYFFQSGCGEKT